MRNRIKASVLLEVLFVLGIMVLAMPIVLNKRVRISEENKIQNVAHRMKILSFAVSNYIQGAPSELKEGLNVIEGEDINKVLVPYGLPTNFMPVDILEQTYQVQIEKTVLEDNVKFNAVVLVFAERDKVPPLMRKKIIGYLGILGGMVEDDGTLVSGSGVWDASEFNWNYTFPADAIIVRINVLNFFNNYISRTKTDELSASNTMLTNLYMNNHNIKMINAVDISGTAYSNNLFGQNVIVENPFGYFEGEITDRQNCINNIINGNMTNENCNKYILKTARFKDLIVSKYFLINKGLNVSQLLRFKSNINTIENVNASALQVYKTKTSSSDTSSDTLITVETAVNFGEADSKESGKIRVEKVNFQDTTSSSNSSSYPNEIAVSGASFTQMILMDPEQNDKGFLKIQSIDADYINFGGNDFGIDFISGTLRVWDASVNDASLAEKIFNTATVLEAEYKTIKAKGE